MMEEITRRLFLRYSAASGAVAAVAAPVVVEAQAEVSAKDRFDFHLAELKKAAEELDPRIGNWNVLRTQDEELGCSVLISAHRVTGRYQGDGLYEGGVENVLGGWTKYQVRLLPDRVDGHRMFSVRTSMDRMMLAEPRLNTFIGGKVAEI